MIPSPLLHTAFFKFTPLPDPDAVVLRLRALTNGLLGSILVAHEGINGVLAGRVAEVQAFEQALRDDGQFHGQFADIAFKHSNCTTPPFARLKVHLKPQVVAVGLPDGSPNDPLNGVDVSHVEVHSVKAQHVEVDRSTLVSPQAWRDLLKQDDVVVLDNRNSFEYRLGRFKTAIDPEVGHFRDFPKYVEDHAATWKAEGKRVAMYCTGGIRCEKTSGWMQSLGLQVLQLEGGILNYFQTLPDADQDWAGECFVFDNRIALNTRLQETATTLEDVYRNEPDGEWRLQRARRLLADATSSGLLAVPAHGNAVSFSDAALPSHDAA